MSAELFIEVRTEELPPSMVRPALDGLRDGLLSLLSGISIGEVRIFATPRRLAVWILDVASHKPVIERTVTGPLVEVAFKDGKPTPAAIGFAKGKGLDVSSITTVDTPKGKAIAVAIQEGGESTLQLLSAGVAEVIRKLPFAKSMEWGGGGVRFGRPISGIAALFGGEILVGQVGDIAFSNETVGHRFSPNPSFSFRSAVEWLAGLRQRWVEPDLSLRAKRIREILDECASERHADPIVDAALEEQVLHLVEWPTKVIGVFEEELLALPPRLLIESMKVHQRYFPIVIAGNLTNEFVAISNNPVGDSALVCAGYARVLRARFHDAKFFFAEDKKKSLTEFSANLARMRWIKGLGTMAQKQQRLAQLAEKLGPMVGAESEIAAAAGRICKADLLSQMVGEFPELQGHMGRLYAQFHGEDELAASAIEEQYYPRFAGDQVPWTEAGTALALADRLDTLVGCFGIGLVPKGGGDPQGLRRAGIGIVNILIQRGLFSDLRQLFALTVHNLHHTVRTSPEGFQAWSKERGIEEIPNDVAGLIEGLVEFALARWKAQMVVEGTSPDLVDAVMTGETRPLVLRRKIEALKALAHSADFLPVLQMFKRVLNISRDADVANAAALSEPEELALEQAISDVDGRVEGAAGAANFALAIQEMMSLKDPIARFFDTILVDAPDASVKAARMSLLQRVSRIFSQVADFSRISTR